LSSCFNTAVFVVHAAAVDILDNLSVGGMQEAI
jgi:hypothetical protein